MSNERQEITINAEELLHAGGEGETHGRSPETSLYELYRQYALRARVFVQNGETPTVKPRSRLYGRTLCPM